MLYINNHNKAYQTFSISTYRLLSFNCIFIRSLQKIYYVNYFQVHVKHLNMDLYADDSTLHFYDHKKIEKNIIPFIFLGT